MWRHRVLACALLTGTLTGRVSAQTPVFFGFPDRETQFFVGLAVEGAAARLGRPGCQDVFDDFTDASGQRLSTPLAASGRSPADAFALLRFYDDRHAPQCRTGVTVAFTQPGSRLIRVCGRQFRNRFQRYRTNTEILMIHEFLHTLGLGENPPSTEAITEQAARRCGD